MAGRVEPPLTEERVREILKGIKFPGFSRDIVSFGIVKSISIGRNNDVGIALHVMTRDPAIPQQIQRDVETALKRCDGIGRVAVEMTAQQPPQQDQMPMAGAGGAPARPQIAGVKHVIAVGSGKGGVGKSTVAVNLACALTKLGQKIGVMDADIYGPSVPKMMGAVRRPTITDEKLDPVENFGLKMMSMALLLDGNSPVIWRGPMIMKAIQQFSLAVNWGELDLLVVDLPPGTGDAQLSLAQTIALDGGVIVTTPQDVALEVARRGIAMFEKVNVRILGIIENMSYYVCPHCGERDDIFSHGGGKQEAERLEVPFLGEIPLFTDIRICGDKGLPIVVAEPNSEPAQAFVRCGETVLRQLEKEQRWEIGVSITNQQVFAKLKECYDPELPCNIVDLGLIYDLRLQPVAGTGDTRIDVKMTLTSQGCPMAGQITAQVQRKLLELQGVGEANVDIVFEPPWGPARISSDGKKTLGLP